MSTKLGGSTRDRKRCRKAVRQSSQRINSKADEIRRIVQILGNCSRRERELLKVLEDLR